MLYGNKSSESISLNIHGNPVSVTDCYKCLGVTLDRRLNMNQHIENVFKRASSRIKLLRKIRHSVTPYVAETIYKKMILPLMLYCSNVYVLSPLNRFQYLQDRARKTVYNNTKSTNEWRTVSCEAKQRCVMDVFKMVNNIRTPENFTQYFSKQAHKINTHGNNNLLKLEKIKTASGHKLFKIAGALLFNDLPQTFAVKHLLPGLSMS